MLRRLGTASGLVLLMFGAATAVYGGHVQKSGDSGGVSFVHYGAAYAAIGAVIVAVQLLTRRRPPPPSPSFYYVSAIHDGQAVFVTGPYPSHDAAAVDIPNVRDALMKEQGGESGRFISWGVSESPHRYEGRANALLGFTAAA